jgi:hypothetical protein
MRMAWVFILFGALILTMCQGGREARAVDGDRAAATEGLGDEGVRAARGRKRSVNNLRQISLAMNNYHDNFGRFPAHAIYSKAGKPFLSWRVAILPFIHQQKLYKEFHLDEPWDSEHNKKLLAKMPNTYIIPGVKTRQPNATFYQAFVGQGAMFEDNLKITFRNITDGTSQTLMLAEAARSVPWTKPDDLAYDPNNPLPKLGVFNDGFHALFAEGSVQWIKKGIPGDILRALITRSGGESVDWSKWVRMR